MSSLSVALHTTLIVLGVALGDETRDRGHLCATTVSISSQLLSLKLPLAVQAHPRLEFPLKLHYRAMDSDEVLRALKVVLSSVTSTGELVPAEWKKEVEILYVNTP